MEPPPPEPIPPLLIDRSLGNVYLPAALRARGIECLTLADVWGEATARQLPDGAWLKYASEMGFPCLSADKLRDLDDADRRALKLRLFVIPRGNLPGPQQCERVLAYADDIRRLIRELPEPWIINLEKCQMRPIWPPGLALSRRRIGR